MTLNPTLVFVVSVLAGFSLVCVLLFGAWLRDWHKEVESDTKVRDERITYCEHAVNSIPVLAVRVDLILEELRTMRAEMRQDRKQSVTHEECNRKNGDV